MRLLDQLDADPEWALVFADDAAVVYVRRTGPLAAVADSFAYRLLPGGTAGIGPLGRKMVEDSTVAAAAHAELLRQVSSSRWNAAAASLLAREALGAGRRDEARRWTEHAIAVAPLMPGEHERLGDLALAEGRAAEALAEFQRERHLRISDEGLETRFGDAHAALGNRGQARRWYERALRHDPTDPRAQAGLTKLGG
jgi:tetratricopeptide (TPR) repeat protein